MTVLYNAPAPNVPFFTPAQYPASGTATKVQHDGKDVPTLFQPLKIRGVTFQNRIWVSIEDLCYGLQPVSCFGTGEALNSFLCCQSNFTLWAAS